MSVTQTHAEILIHYRKMVRNIKSFSFAVSPSFINSAMFDTSYINVSKH